MSSAGRFDSSPPRLPDLHQRNPSAGNPSGCASQAGPSLKPRLFQQHGSDPQRQVPIPVNAAISIDDFAVPEDRLAIYIDGAAFHVGAHLRRDRRIRDSLRQGTSDWIVEELRAADFYHGLLVILG